jgi:hypothetical protein
MKAALILPLLQLVARLVEKLVPARARDKLGEPSTVVGLAELVAILAALNVPEEWRLPVALLALGGVGVYNILRRESPARPH